MNLKERNFAGDHLVVGSLEVLGNINMILLAIYAIFASILFSNVVKEDAPKEVESKEEKAE